MEFCREGIAGVEAAVAADEFYVIEVGAGAGLPFAGDGAGVAGAGGETDAGDDVGAAAWCFEHGLGAAESAEGGGIVGDDDLGGHGAEADEGGIGPEDEGGGDAVPALREVN